MSGETQEGALAVEKVTGPDFDTLSGGKFEEALRFAGEGLKIQAQELDKQASELLSKRLAEKIPHEEYTTQRLALRNQHEASMLMGSLLRDLV